MATEISRQALYELVWTSPRTTLAKQFGVSDVAIGKQCAKAHVPVPPPGYWARLQHGKSSFRPPLPMRLPGQADLVQIGSSRDHWYQRPKENLDEPLEPPVFLEDMDFQVAVALKLIGRIPASKDLSNPHASVRHVLLAEEKRREKFEKEGRYSWDQPRFDAPHHQRQLRLFNSLAHALDKVFDRIYVDVKDEWIQGHGTQHFLSLRIQVSGGYLSLEFQEPGDVRFKRKDEVLKTTLKAGNGSSDLGEERWSDEPYKTLERQLDDIVKMLLIRAEKVLRRHAEYVYEYKCERRRELLEEQEAARREQERQRLEAISNQQKKIRQDIMQLADDRRVAREIREMVNDMSAHPDLAHGNAGAFEQWKKEALLVADGLDPMMRSLPHMLASLIAVPQGNKPV